MSFLSIPIGQKYGYKSYVKDGETVEIKSGGADIWGKRDELMFYCKEIAGDFTAIARLESFEKSDLYAKAGIMARETPDDKSPHVILAAFPNNSKRNKNNGGYEFQYREKVGMNSFAIYPSDYVTEPPMYPADYPNVWLKLERKGDTFICYCGSNGSDWKLYSSYDLALSKNLYVGLAATAHSKDAMTVAKFSNVVIKQ